MPKQKQKGAGTKKFGRNKIKCAAYARNNTREKHKIVRIAKSSGKGAALEYAKKYQLTGWATTRLSKFKVLAN